MFLKLKSWAPAVLPLLGGSLFYTTSLRNSLPDILAASMPSALWSFSMTVSLCWIWAESPFVYRFFAGIAALCAAIGFEILQWPGIFPGTFDWLDLLFSAVACVAAFAVSCPWFNRMSFSSKTNQAQPCIRP